MLILFLTQLVIIGFILWKLYNYEISRNQLFEIIKRHEEFLKIHSLDIVRIKRTFNSTQAAAFTETICSCCGKFLPENTFRNALTGKLLCNECKVKEANEKELVEVKNG